MLIKQLYRIG